MLGTTLTITNVGPFARRRRGADPAPGDRGDPGHRRRAALAVGRRRRVAVRQVMEVAMSLRPPHDRRRDGQRACCATSPTSSRTPRRRSSSGDGRHGTRTGAVAARRAGGPWATHRTWARAISSRTRRAVGECTTTGACGAPHPPQRRRGARRVPPPPLASSSVYRRYFSLHPGLSEAEVEHLTTVDYDDRLALILVDEGRHRGPSARYDRYPGTTAPRSPSW